MTSMYKLKLYLQFAKIAPVTNPCARLGPHTVSTVNLSRDAAKNLATCAKVFLTFFDVYQITFQNIRLNIITRIIVV